MSKNSTRKTEISDYNWNTKDRPLKWEDILVDTPNNEEKNMKQMIPCSKKQKKFA